MGPQLGPLGMLSLPGVVSGNLFVVRWSSASNCLYTLEHSTNLASGFSPLTNHIPAAPPVNVYTDSVGGVPQKVYRVRVEP